MKKTIKYLTLGMLFFGTLTMYSCKKYATKDDLKEYATQSDLNNSQAKVFNYNLTFAAGSTYEIYDGIKGFQKGDIIVTYLFYESLGGDDNYWVQLPFYLDSQINIFAEYSELDGYMFINAQLDDGSAPWMSPTPMSLKSVLIKANGLKTHPDLDLKKYEEVAKVFNLE